LILTEKYLKVSAELADGMIHRVPTQLTELLKLDPTEVMIDAEAGAPIDLLFLTEDKRKGEAGRKLNRLIEADRDQEIRLDRGDH
jgi:hypothetical protein